MTEDKDGSRPSALERHIQSGIQLILVALVIWIGNALQDTREKVIRMEAQVAEMTVKIISTGDDRYRGRDAQRDFAFRDDKLRELEIRLRSLEDTVTRHNADSHAHSRNTR